MESRDSGRPDPTDVEVKAAFLERTVETLNEVIIEQGRTIEDLGRRLERLEALAQGGAGDQEGARDPQAEQPPHY